MSNPNAPVPPEIAELLTGIDAELEGLQHTLRDILAGRVQLDSMQGVGLVLDVDEFRGYLRKFVQCSTAFNTSLKIFLGRARGTLGTGG